MDRVTPTDLESLLRADEGEVLHGYYDSRGFLSLGVGRLIDVRKGGGISKAESSLLLSNDIVSKAQQPCRANFKWFPLIDPVRQAVIESLAFNLGIEGLLHFPHFLMHVAAGRFPEAAQELLNSHPWIDQVGERGFRLAKQMQTGAWQ